MKIQVWSDYACPFCWIGEARLKKAITEPGLDSRIRIEPGAFELNPEAPKTSGINGLMTIARRYGMTPQQARLEFEKIAELGRKEGLKLTQEDAHHTNTFVAHRLMKMGLETGNRALAEKLNELLFAAFFVANLNLADHSVLKEGGKRAGLGMENIYTMLDSDEYKEAVRADEEFAASRGVRGVPWFLFPNGSTLSGAVSLEEFKAALSNSTISSGAGDSGHCGPEGCSL